MKKLIIVLLAVCMSASAFAQKDKKPKPEDLLLMIETLQAQVTDLQGHVDAFGPHSPDFSLLLDGLDRYYDDNGYDTFIFSGMIVQIVNGSNSTSTTGGMGNLIIGYNEYHGSDRDDRDGSHNLIIGDYNNYTAPSYGGMVVGSNNEIDGNYSSVSGGLGNTASGYSSSVSSEATPKVHEKRDRSEDLATPRWEIAP